MKIFITGISGFIGRYVAKEALKRGYEVCGMDIVDLKKWNMPNVAFCKGDITVKEDVEKAMPKDVDYVIHLAAITSNEPFKTILENCFRVNVQGFINVIDAAARRKCKKFLYASSAAVYYADSFNEDFVIDVKKQGNHYARTKLMDEIIANSYDDIYKMKTIGLRFFNTYGPTGEEKTIGVNMINIFIVNKKKQEPIILYGDGGQARDFIYIDDVVYLTMAILERGDEKLYNIGTGVATKFSAIAHTIAGNEISVKFQENPYPVNQYQMLSKADMNRTLKLVGKGYKFVSVEEGIKKTEEAYKTN